MDGQFPVTFMDAPQVLNASVTAIPGSGSLPLQVVSDTGKKAVYSLQYIDSTGDYIGVYLGKVGVETLSVIIGGGHNTTIPCLMAVHSRVSLRSITASPITSGYLSCNFLGFP